MKRTSFPFGDGYDWMEYMSRLGYRPISSWGRDGWDLGSWPLVVVMFRGDRDFAQYCEGDVDTFTFSSSEMREQATDSIALYWWRMEEAEWLNRDPADLKGPYRSRVSS